MKNVLLLLFFMLLWSSCSTKLSSEEIDKLPKDIALKPDNIIAQQKDKEKLNVLIREIDALIATEKCEDISNWSFWAIGAKPCGGPSSYIAYPKNMEAEILEKIKIFTAQQFAFNMKYRLTSDCILVEEPTGIKCENGKAVLLSGNSERE